MSQNYTDINTHLVMNDMTETQFSNLQSVDPDQLYLTEDESANQDLSNLTDAGKIVGSSLGMPSSTYTDLTLGASASTYTAPANGLFYVSKRSGVAGEYIALGNDNIGYEEDYAGAANQVIPLRISVKKGEVVNLFYSLSGATAAFKFIYSVGSESEAS